ncbi:homoprotocatechuate degradation operon regulator HpaR [Alcaligenes endophyticus]|uniref:Homoprotocatechuate degradation operon regulator HpaR n=1 Tax=Alcaligenes endophyticus TaxID=1929088 RepID=A0ABT8EM66_9BURK|nr:homoprotocatechuate degradation operon regulator HpaR [Alcaligenes endophyticus]MCX5591026.1 homoprotocatechuate degradation operon regulator HpaR [Alcaligenes endophyticus]MDN4122397.1 homoprotocatechuate degradation operon regulator HpaR [Alcaligenes endophyticus]
MNRPTQRCNLPLLLLRAREAVMAYFRIELRRYGLTEQQWRVIRALDSLEDLEAGRIAEEAFILAPSLSGVLARMEKAGLVKRFRKPCDMRKVYVKLTPYSQNLAVELRACIEEHYKNIETLLGTDTLEVLVKGLEKAAVLPAPTE